MKKLIAVMLLVIGSLNVQLAHSADNTGNFWYGAGTGSIMCPQFVASMKNARSIGLDSAEFFNVTRAYTNYLFGFQTGYNMSTKDTCDIFSNDKTSYSLLLWVEDYCRANASSRFADGVVALAKDRYAKRLQVCSK
jgi:hypothetical protein